MADRVLTLDRAAIALGMPARTIRRRIAEGQIPAYVDPRDRRRKLVRIVDLKNFVGDDLELKLSA